MRRSARFFVFMIIGVLLVLTGLIVGLTSHYATFKSVGQDTIAHYLLGDGTGYLKMSNSSNLYVVHQNDFTPSLATLQDGDTISFVYNPDDTQNIDETSTIGTHLSGNAATVVAITATGATSGQSTTYTTAAYRQNSQGTYQNNWTAGGTTLFIGLIFVVLAFVLPKKKSASFSVSAGIPLGTPQANPYQQPYPGQTPYQQQPYAGQYPPANQYQQPAQPGQYPLPQQYNPGQAANLYAPQQPNVPQAPTQYGGYPPPPPSQQQSSGYEPTERANPYDPSNS